MKGRSEGWKMEEGKTKRKEERIKNKEKERKKKCINKNSTNWT